MSRIAKAPIALGTGVEVKIDGQQVTVKGSKVSMEMTIHPDVEVSQEDRALLVRPRKEETFTWAMAGTMRSLLNNMVIGVTDGFEKKLKLIGVGYRARVKGKILDLSLGYSHSVEFAIPEGVSVRTPSATEVVVMGSDKQQVGQTAAEIRAYRLPEPYKGKGIRYADEYVIRKEAKKT